MLGDGRGEGDDVVLRDLLDRLDAGDVERAALADVARGLGRNDPGARHRVGGGCLDLQPGLVFPLVAPDATHLRIGVPRDHPDCVNSTCVMLARHARPSRRVTRPRTTCPPGDGYAVAHGRSSQPQPLARNLEAVDGAKDGRAERVGGEQVARDALDVVARHALDPGQRLV